MDKSEAIEALQAKFKNVRSDDALTVWHYVTHVSRSGASRSIKFFIIRNGQPISIDWLMVQSGTGKLDRNNGGIRVNGGGMDMGFNSVYNLSYRLFNGTARHKKSGRDAGYILNSRWL